MKINWLRTLKRAPVFVVGLSLLAGTANAQMENAWRMNLPGQGDGVTFPVTDATGTVFVQYCDYTQPLQVSPLHIRRISWTGETLFDWKCTDPGVLGADLKITPYSAGTSQRLVVIYAPVEQSPPIFIRELDTSGHQLWLGPTQLNVYGYYGVSADAAGNLTFLCQLTKSDPHFSFLTVSSQGVQGQPVPIGSLNSIYQQPYPLPNGNWLINSEWDAPIPSSWGVYQPSTGNKLFGDSTATYHFAVTAAPDGTVAICAVTQPVLGVATVIHQNISIYSQAGMLKGSLDDFSLFFINDMIFDAGNKLYLLGFKGIGYPYYAAALDENASLLWNEPYPWNGNFLAGPIAGSDGFYSGYPDTTGITVPAKVFVYHMSSSGKVDILETQLNSDNTLLVAHGASGDDFLLSFLENSNHQLTQLLERYVSGPALASVTASAVTGPNQMITITVKSNAAAPVGGLTIKLITDDSAITLGATSVTIPAGKTSITTNAHVGTLKRNPATIQAQGPNNILRDATISY
ncbi:MAG TPA: hypothetical protein VGL56_12785 [Fimbriimonadaceae bacterium]